jgi:hypothetical protein
VFVNKLHCTRARRERKRRERETGGKERERKRRENIRLRDGKRGEREKRRSLKGWREGGIKYLMHLLLALATLLKPTYSDRFHWQVLAAPAPDAQHR